MEDELNSLMRPRKICLCKDVNREQIVTAVRAGARSLAVLQQLTQAATGCGTCLPRVLEVFYEATHKIQDEEKGQARFENLK